MKDIILSILLIYFCLGIIYVTFNWRKVLNSYNGKMLTFSDGFISGLYMCGAMICFPYYIYKSNNKK